MLSAAQHLNSSIWRTIGTKRWVMATIRNRKGRWHVQVLKAGPTSLNRVFFTTIWRSILSARARAYNRTRELCKAEYRAFVALVHWPAGPVRSGGRPYKKVLSRGKILSPHLTPAKLYKNVFGPSQRLKFPGMGHKTAANPPCHIHCSCCWNYKSSIQRSC